MPLRHAGQYFDSEVGLFYNYFRDYNPKTGRYVESDPIGLKGGMNTYGYVGGSPAMWTDPHGLHKGDKLFGLPKQFWQWYHRQEKRPGDPDLDKPSADDLHREWLEKGKPGPDNKGPQKNDSNPILQWFIPPALELACMIDPCNPLCAPFGANCESNKYCI